MAKRRAVSGGAPAIHRRKTLNLNVRRDAFRRSTSLGHSTPKALLQNEFHENFKTAMMQIKLKRIIFCKNINLAFLLIAGIFPACHAPRSRPAADAPVIRLKGSDTMVTLAQSWAEKYMQQHAGVAVYVEGGGTAIGIEALIKGEIEICTASRPLRPEEVQRLAKRQQNVGIAHLVAKDGLSIYLHPSNPVRSLTLAQVKGIYTGQLTNWREAGGKDQVIVVLSRAPSSGTYFYFQEHVLDGQPYGTNAKNLPTTAAIVQEVEKNPAAIGYGGLAYGENLVHCKINGVSPAAESVRADKYPITRYLYFYTIKKPEGAVKLFIDWVLSKDGQRVVKEIDYVPLFDLP